VYTPGKSGLAQSTPKLVTPTRVHLPPRLLATIPPPESPWQVSVPPRPAQSCFSVNLTPTGRYLAEHSSAPTTGTCASLSLLTVPPPTNVAPHPVIVGDGLDNNVVRFLPRYSSGMQAGTTPGLNSTLEARARIAISLANVLLFHNGCCTTFAIPMSLCPPPSPPMFRSVSPTRIVSAFASPFTLSKQ